ncbi:Subtilase family (plasmid) [Rubrobacter radiotolerans]|nr:Subtilase family [Rubrobacter radiotolerans]
MIVTRPSRASATKRNSLRITALLVSVLVAASLGTVSAKAQSAAPGTLSEQLVPPGRSAADTLPSVENEVVVVMKDGASIEDTRRMASSLNGRVVEERSPAGSEKIEVIEFKEARGDKALIASKARELSQAPGVISAEPNSLVEMHYRPNDTFFSQPRGSANQGNLSLIGMPAAWSKSKGAGAGIGIADSGLPPRNYGELPATKVLAQTDVLNGDSVAEDNAGHGSAVSALAAAKTDNRFGMAGAGFNAKVAMCKFSTRLPNGGVGGTKDGLIKCIDWLQKRSSVDVLNLSLGLAKGETSPGITREIKETQELYGKVVVASVGNDGTYTRTQLPASLPGVIGVGSIDSRSSRSSFSNYGPYVDLMAPGNGVVSYVVQNEKPAFAFGTSFSAPQVAGCAALLSAKNYNAGQIKNRLLKSATNMGPAGRDDQTGYGYLNCGKALSN